jgi:hypothetical protein
MGMSARFGKWFARNSSFVALIAISLIAIIARILKHHLPPDIWL